MESHTRILQNNNNGNLNSDVSVKIRVDMWLDLR